MRSIPLDFYDDPTASILRSRISNPSSLPQFIKEAQDLRGQDLDEGQYALVLYDEEGNTRRKFACVDPGNTALSVIYFLANKDLLPPEAVKVASLNLISACETHQLAPPRDLLKVASSSLAETLPYTGESRVLSILDKDTAPPVPEYTEPSSSSNDAVTAGLVQSLEDHREKLHSWKKNELEAEKTAAAESRYVLNSPVVSLQEPEISEALAHLLGDSYAIYSDTDVKVAEAYFDDHENELDPWDRHVYCVNLVKVGSALGVDVESPAVMKYASTGVGPGFEMLVSSRMQYIGSDFASVLDAIMEKKASADPEELATALAHVDHALGLDRLWGTYVPDPWYTVFHQEKVAGFSYTREDGKIITEDDLRDLGTKDRAKLSAVFDEDFVDSFSQEPVEAFSALPGPTKRVIAGLV